MKKILFKVSGDLIHNKNVLNDIKRESHSNHVSLIYGMGTMFSEALNKLKIPFEYINGIRTTTEEGLKVGFDISQKLKSNLENELGKVHLISPIKKHKNKIININGDELVIQEYKNYDKVIVYTLKGRAKDKLKRLPNLEVREV